MTVHAIAPLRRLFEYDAWANREALASLRRAGSPPPQARRVMAHVVGAGRLWLGRLERAAEAAVVWPDLTLDECERQSGELARAWQAWFEGRGDETLAEPVSYVNSKGEAWTSTAGDILAHVVLHGAYHRGQIASELRRHGHEPAYTDFIHAVRQGFVR